MEIDACDSMTVVSLVALMIAARDALLRTDWIEVLEPVIKEQLKLPRPHQLALRWQYYDPYGELADFVRIRYEEQTTGTSRGPPVEELNEF